MANRIVLTFNTTYGFAETLGASDNIDMQSSGKVVNLAAATTSGDALAYGQAGASLGGLSMTGNIAMGSNKITSLGTPTASGDAVNKDYVDGLVNGVVWKQPVKAASTSNVASLSGSTTLDGISVSSGDRVLLKNQSTGAENGIWLVAVGAWTRPSDFPSGGSAAANAVFVEEGSTQADTAYVCTNDPPNDIIDTNSLTWVQFSAAGSYTAGNGITILGNVISVKAGDGIETTSNANSTNVRLDGTAPGLQFTGLAGSGALQVKNDPNGGLQVSASGEAIKVDSTTSGNPTVAVGSNGLRVIGLPLNFNINSVATSSNVTASNLGTLTAGENSDASSLHTHSKIKFSAVTVSALAAGDPVYWSSTNNNVDKALANTDAKSFVCGLNDSSVVSASGTANIITSGFNTGVLTGATAGTVYYLDSTGGVTSSVPGSGNNIIQVGFSTNSTDLFVQVQRFGKKV